MNLYVTTAEIKTYLSITSSAQDSLIAMLNKFATDDLNGMLSASDLSLHKVTAEVHDGGTDRVELNDIHVRAIGTIMEGDSLEYSQTDAYDVDNYVLHLDGGLNCGEREAKIDYAAGWNAGGYITLTIDAYASITSATVLTITPNGASAVTLTEGTEWDAETDNDTTAQNIVDAINDHASLGGSDTGIRAFALKNVIYVVDKVPQQETSTFTISDPTGMTLSGGTLNGVDFPESLREAIFLLVAGKLAKRKNARVRSYTIGTKTVTFANDNDHTAVEAAIAKYKRAKAYVI